MKRSRSRGLAIRVQKAKFHWLQSIGPEHKSKGCRVASLTLYPKYLLSILDKQEADPLQVLYRRPMYVINLRIDCHSEDYCVCIYIEGKVQSSTSSRKIRTNHAQCISADARVVRSHGSKRGS